MRDSSTIARTASTAQAQADEVRERVGIMLELMRADEGESENPANDSEVRCPVTLQQVEAVREACSSRSRVGACEKAAAHETGTQGSVRACQHTRPCMCMTTHTSVYMHTKAQGWREAAAVLHAAATEHFGAHWCSKLATKCVRYAQSH